MVRSFIIFLLMTVISFSCTPKKKAIQIQENATKEAPVYFPVTSYIKGELSTIPQLQVTPLKIINSNGHDDSTWLKLQDIAAFATPFLNPVIDSATLSHYYKETSFVDQTINSITLSYDPIDAQHDPLALKSLSVYIDPLTNKVTRIYIEKQLPAEKGSVLQQLTWKSGKWCKITTITEMEGKPPVIKDEKVIWDFNDQ